MKLIKIDENEQLEFEDKSNPRNVLPKSQPRLKPKGEVRVKRAVAPKIEMAQFMKNKNSQQKNPVEGKGGVEKLGIRF